MVDVNSLLSPMSSSTSSPAATSQEDYLQWDIFKLYAKERKREGEKEREGECLKEQNDNVFVIWHCSEEKADEDKERESSATSLPVFFPNPPWFDHVAPVCITSTA
ncbi:unnamed protein product [Thelazia callipaeda]|uniref:Uncharacterized protein n=1 Tax=Thelazia callipaeda TaxID=103827 RepID=A0A0N5CUD3_THECL|nr:unnamed protein product [Thelazia callipaeda]